MKKLCELQFKNLILHTWKIGVVVNYYKCYTIFYNKDVSSKVYYGFLFW